MREALRRLFFRSPNCMIVPKFVPSREHADCVRCALESVTGRTIPNLLNLDDFNKTMRDYMDELDMFIEVSKADWNQLCKRLALGHKPFILNHGMYAKEDPQAPMSRTIIQNHAVAVDPLRSVLHDSVAGTISGLDRVVDWVSRRAMPCMNLVTGEPLSEDEANTMVTNATYEPDIEMVLYLHRRGR